ASRRGHRRPARARARGHRRTRAAPGARVRRPRHRRARRPGSGRGGARRGRARAAAGRERRGRRRRGRTDPPGVDRAARRGDGRAPSLPRRAGRRRSRTRMTTNPELLGAVTDLVPFLRWRVGAFEAEELPAAGLIDDADRLAEAIAATAAGRGTDDPQVAASLWWQSYAYRVAG